MKTSSRTPVKAKEARRSFAWDIRTSDIGFMQADAGKAAMDGSSYCDCGGITRTPKPRTKGPARRTGE